MKNYVTAALVVSLAFVSAGVRAQTAGPTDPQIAHIVVTANQVDIDAAKLAKRKTGSKEVKKFAELMITDHTSVIKQATALVKKLKVTPENNATSESLKKGGDENVANIKKLKGKAFDTAYIDHEVTYHQAVIDTIDKTLIPAAKNEELKALMVKVRPVLDMHLEQAIKLRADIEMGMGESMGKGETGKSMGEGKTMEKSGGY